MGTVGLIVSVTGKRYGRETFGTIAIAAIDIQEMSSTVLHDTLFLLYSYCELYTETRYMGVNIVPTVIYSFRIEQNRFKIFMLYLS